jgi:hypothetical protein
VDDVLRAELARRVEVDQAMRRAWLARPGDRVDENDLAEFGAVDEDNTAWLRQVVAEHGWPGRTLVGENGAHDAWMLAQHADHDPEFQTRCLALLAAAVDAGEASAADLAYLTDRSGVSGANPSSTAPSSGTDLTVRTGYKPGRSPTRTVSTNGGPPPASDRSANTKPG